MPSNVFRRGDSWCARVTVNGELRWLGSYESEEEALAVVAAARGGVMPSAETVGGWFARWPVVATSRRRRKLETVRHTAMMARPFVARFGERRMAALRRPEVLMWALEHPSSVRWARTVLADAVWAGLLEANVLTGVRSSAGELSVDPPTVADVDRLAALAPDPLARMVLLAAYSGLRLSEVAALEARDVDCGLDGTRLAVRHGKGDVARTSLLFAPGVPALRGMPEVGRLFRRPVSRRGWDRSSVNRIWVKVRDEAGVPDCRFHSLRHFHATWLWDQGVSPQDIAAQLGHRDGGELVRKRYGHPSHDMALSRIQEVIARAGAA